MHRARILRRWSTILIGCISLAGCTLAEQPTIGETAPSPTAGFIPEEIKLGLPYPPPAVATSAPAAAASPLKQQDPAPPGVVALQAAAPVTDTLGSICQGGLDASLGPQVRVERLAYEMAEGVGICLSGFVAHQPIAIEVLRPDGVVRHYTAPRSRQTTAKTVDYLPEVER